MLAVLVHVVPGHCFQGLRSQKKIPLDYDTYQSSAAAADNSVAVEIEIGAEPEPGIAGVRRIAVVVRGFVYTGMCHWIAFGNDSSHLQNPSAGPCCGCGRGPLRVQQYGRGRDRQNGCRQTYGARPWSEYRYQ